MVRPHFIKISPSGKSHGIVSKGVTSKNAMLYSNTNESFCQRQVRAYSPTTRRCEPVKEKYQLGSSSQFLDIDGNEPISLNQTADLGPKDTSHKIKRHLSLYDLTQKLKSVNVKKPSLAGNSGAVSESSQTTDIDKPKSTADKCALPKGSRQLDQPYIVPKFMPSFRELMIETRKENPMISITESTPPSLQKWAVEWNSEPKGLSISELKEDILREAEESVARREGKIYNDAKSSIEARVLDDGTSRAHEGQQRKTVSEPLTLPRGVVFSPPDLLSSRKNEKSNLGWLPEKYNRLKTISVGYRKAYSFAEAISRKDSNSAINNHSDSIPRIFKQRSHVYDEEEQEFYEWFKEKLSKASESSILSEQTPSMMSNSNYEGREISSETTRAALPQDDTNIDQLAERIPDVEKPSEILAPRKRISPSEKSSSFYQWLSSRICIPVDRSSWRENPKPKTNCVDESGDPKTPMFPWSRSYASKFPSDKDDQGPNKKADFSDAFLNKPSSANETAFYRKVKSQMTFRKPKLSRVHKTKSLVRIRPVTVRKPNNKNRIDDEHGAAGRKSVPYSQWIVNSEVDHVQHLRSLESLDVTVNATNSANDGYSQQPGSFPHLKQSGAYKDTEPSVGIPWSVEGIAGKPLKFPNSNSPSIVTSKVSPPDVRDVTRYFSISDDAPIMGDSLLGSQKFKDETDCKAFEDDAEEAGDTENVESLKRTSETSNALWAINNHQPREVNFSSDVSIKHGFGQDLNDPKMNADGDRLKIDRDYLHYDEEATDADWKRTVGPKSIWPSDDDLIRRLGGEATKIDLFALRSHTRPL